jgi:Leucine-rich repeat (LRR) protein
VTSDERAMTYFRLVLFVSVTNVFLVDVAMTSSHCPSECLCTKSVADCRSQSLNDTNLVRVIKQLPPNMLIDVDLGDNSLSTTRPLQTNRLQIQRLVLDSCRISRLERHSFRYMHFVEIIDLSNNTIEFIDRDAFRGLRSIRELILSRNRLSTVSAHLFEGLTLNSLHLDNNVIESIDDDAFSAARVISLNMNNNRLSVVANANIKPLANSLKKLTISHNHVPLVITSDALDSFSLSALDVSSSHLTSLSFLENIASVERLSVGGNQLGDVTVSWSAGLSLTCQYAGLNDIGLTSISPQLLFSIRSVETLDLSSNLLRSIDPVVFKQVPDVRSLDLSRNLLTSLPDQMGLYLTNLERLNLSANTLTTLSDQFFRSLDKLKLLDLSSNLLQTLPQSISGSMTSLNWLDVARNRLHCNCELRWFREWIATDGQAIVQPGASCSSPAPVGLAVERSAAEFQCTRPTILYVTTSMNVLEGSDVILSCTAQSDPAPSVTWSSPSNEVVTISPSDDRQQHRLSAMWQLRRARATHSGWYECSAINSYGNSTAYTYIHVTTSNENGVVDMAGLTYPAIPPPFTTQPSTISTESRLVTQVIDTSTSLLQELSTAITYANYDVTADATPVVSDSSDSSLITSRSYTHHRDVINEGNSLSVEVIVSAGGAIFVVLLLVVLCIVRRKHKRSGNYAIARSSGAAYWSLDSCFYFSPAEVTEHSKLNMLSAPVRSNDTAMQII